MVYRWPYLTWPWPLLSIWSTLICYLPHLLGNLAKFELAAVISSVTVADKTKSDDFDLWPDLDRTCDLCRLKKMLKKCSSRAFDYRLTRPTTATRSRVGRWGGQLPPPPPPSGARSAKYPSGARVDPVPEANRSFGVWLLEGNLGGAQLQLGMTAIQESGIE